MLDLMRTHNSQILAVALLSLFFVAFPTFSGATNPQSATVAYVQRLQIILTRAAVQTISTHSVLSCAGRIWITCRVGAHGDVQNVDVACQFDVRGGTDAFVYALKSVKLPPIPKAVLTEQGENSIDVKIHIGIDQVLTNR